jgi:hypothetical protein
VKAKGGRPRLDRPTGRKATVYLLPAIEELARIIGDGNVSGGLSKAVREYRFPIRQRAADSGSLTKGK